MGIDHLLSVDKARIAGQPVKMTQTHLLCKPPEQHPQGYGSGVTIWLNLIYHCASYGESQRPDGGLHYDTVNVERF